MARVIAKISLQYGSKVVDIKVPSNNLLAVASPRDVATRADVATQVRHALRAPIDAVPFSAMLRGGENLLLLVDDITRPTPTDEILPVLLQELEVEQKKIETTILIALGTHRKMTQEEIERKVGRSYGKKRKRKCL